MPLRGNRTEVSEDPCELNISPDGADPGLEFFQNCLDSGVMAYFLCEFDMAGKDHELVAYVMAGYPGDEIELPVCPYERLTCRIRRDWNINLLFSFIRCRRAALRPGLSRLPGCLPLFRIVCRERRYRHLFGRI
jgi:hypothetical protein